MTLQFTVDYVHVDSPASLLAATETLAVFGFGPNAPTHVDPRYLRVPLQPYGTAFFEQWRARAPVMRGRDGDIAWAEDDALQFGAIELDEDDSDIATCAERVYAQLHAFIQRRGFPHLLKIWNYLDAITEGEGDNERYRQFCVGRARGIGTIDTAALPAATVIGRCDGVRRLQVYWLAARRPGTPIENPRQVSAYSYPKQYGPQSPSFARAMLRPKNMPLLLSGTSSVVGHESRHAGSVIAQLDETFLNFDSLIDAARKLDPSLPAAFGIDSRLKVYVRDREALPQVAAALDTRFVTTVPRLLLHAAICRRDLGVEIDGVHA